MKLNIDLIKRILIAALGFAVSAMGATVFLLCDLGSDSFTVAMQGISKHTPLSIGIANSCSCVVLIAIIFVLEKQFIKIGTIVAMFVLGPMMNAWDMVLAPYFVNVNGFILKMLILIVALFIICLGVASVFAAKIGAHANDTMPAVLTFKIGKFQLRTFRIGQDLFYLVLGYLLGGTVGIGTLMCAFGIGPLLQFFIPKAEIFWSKVAKIEIKEVV